MFSSAALVRRALITFAATAKPAKQAAVPIEYRPMEVHPETVAMNEKRAIRTAALANMSSRSALEAVGCLRPVFDGTWAKVETSTRYAGRHRQLAWPKQAANVTHTTAQHTMVRGPIEREARSQFNLTNQGRALLVALLTNGW
jgi:hypothetical protein